MLTTQEIRKLQEKELIDEINRTSRDLMKAKLDLENGSSKESHKMINTRRYLARLKTIKKETEKSESQTAPAKKVTELAKAA
jgi:ribosomal protein L29